MTTTVTDPPVSTTAALLADATRLGGVELTITDLARSLDFYTRVIGLSVHERGDRHAALGAGGEDIVTLRADPAARPPGRHAGLYHVALLFPTREELARAGARVAATRTRIDGASDHGTHEAIYLPDPDGIGLELAADRPRERWPDLSGAEFVAHGPQPLDVGALFATIDAEWPGTGGEAPSAPAAAGLRIGHLHLHVGDLDASTRFYRDGLGFEVKTTMPTASFVSAGGYHHHVAYNLWRGGGVGPAPDGVVGLRHWTLECAGQAELEAVRARLATLGVPFEPRDGGTFARDPSRIAVLIR
ncbi:MAG TPA: VOC family protein [Solirubrobacteraceae bacterium]|nr:VOC family protein [Solirubrobacteraceae bacterium]